MNLKIAVYRLSYVTLFVTIIFLFLFIRYAGPPSETLSFDTPEGVPGTVLNLEAFPMGSSALFLAWTKPAEPNGILTGYRIYYESVNGTRLGPLLERKPHIIDPEATSAKLAALAPDMKYRVHVRATTKVGEGNEYVSLLSALILYICV